MPALDAGLVAAAQAVEHYEISRYGTLSTWAEELGYDEAVQLLEETLTEEKKTTLNSRLAGPSGIQLRRYKAKFKSDANATQPAYGINKSAASRLARHCRPIKNRIRPSSRMMTESPMAKLCKRKTIGDQRKLSAICPSQTWKARLLTSCR